MEVKKVKADKGYKEKLKNAAIKPVILARDYFAKEMTRNKTMTRREAYLAWNVSKYFNEIG